MSHACKHIFPLMNNTLHQQQQPQQQQLLTTPLLSQKRSKKTLTKVLRDMRKGPAKVRSKRDKKYFRQVERKRTLSILKGPFRKGVVTGLLVRPPRRPNSAA